ncbi:YitT family protein [Oscillospiraceae bacterium MB08-C2-2]|nr:YitT family protein [Oscillospiraceae bacterium MB08-C2-2]
MSMKILDSAKPKGNIFQLLFATAIIEIGLMISSFGTALFYAASLGSSPMATFSDGIHNLLSISYGTANMVMNILLLIVLFFLERKHINIGTVLCVFTIGPWVNIFNALLQGLNIAEMNLAIRILCTVLGTVLMGTGLGLYVAVDRGFGALEGLVKVLCERAGMSTSKAKILQDIILVAGGVLLGATWGIGTVIAIVFTGPLLNQSIKIFSGRVLKQLQHPQN